MYKELKKIYDKTRTEIFIMGISHLLTIGFNNATQISDEQLASIKDAEWASAGFLRQIVVTAREIAVACGNNPVELIQFCMVENCFDTTFYAPDKKKIPYIRMEEIATRALWGVYDNEDFEDVNSDLDLDESEMAFFGIPEDIEEEE